MKHVVGGFYPAPEVRANARLIAEAPAMRELLQQAAVWSAAVRRSNDLTACKIGAKSINAKLRALLARLDGQG